MIKPNGIASLGYVEKNIERFNHIVIAYIKEYKTRNDWVGEVISAELYKRLKFDKTTKCYMLKPESVLKKETYETVCGFELQTDHLFLMRRSDQVE